MDEPEEAEENKEDKLTEKRALVMDNVNVPSDQWDSRLDLVINGK